jgi:hypothetical protein
MDDADLEEIYNFYKVLYDSAYSHDEDYEPPNEYNDVVKRFIDTLPKGKTILTADEYNELLNENDGNDLFEKTMTYCEEDDDDNTKGNRKSNFVV